jgi:hypothetical protein
MRWRPDAQLRAADALYTGDLYVPTSFHLQAQQGDVALKVHVKNVCFKYSMCFRGMLQVF